MKSTIGLIAGVTPAIDLFTQTLNVLGERFLKFRFKQNRSESRKKAIEFSNNERTMREELVGAVAYYMKNLTVPEVAELLPKIPKEIQDMISNLAELTALARTMIPRSLGDYGGAEVGRWKCDA